MKSAVLYVRVSSKEQKEEGYSIPAQKKLLRDYAKKNNLRIVKTFEEEESAKRAGRREFEKMVTFVKKNKKVQHILVEKTDRLTRNFADMVKLDDLGRNIHFAKEGQIIGPDAKSTDKLGYGMKVLIARHYTDNLSEETSKGMREKAEQGLWPSYAPLGYSNDKDTPGGLRIDLPRARVIRQMFEVYADGSASIGDVRALAKKEGLTTRKGRAVQKSSIATILQNPIYIGDFVWNGVYHTGKHEGIVSREIFERVQRLVKSKHRSRKKARDFAFRGLLRCGNCGCLVTAEIKKERYVYYRCTHGRGNCTEKPVREEVLAEQLGEPLKRLRLTKERVEWILQCLRANHEENKRHLKVELRRLEGERQELEIRIDKVYEDKMSGAITEAFWKRKYREYVEGQNRIEELIGELEMSDKDYLDSAARVFELAEKAFDIYVSRDSFEKRKIVEKLLSNCTLKGRRVWYELREPFDTIADGVEEEARLLAVNTPKNIINQIWLPG